MKAFKIGLIICLFLTLSLISCQEKAVETTQPEVTANSSGAAPITTIAPKLKVPVIMPQKPVIVFCSDRKGGNYELYYMSIDGSNVTQVTSSEYLDYYPRFSPDGSKIVYGSKKDAAVDIFIMDTDGKNAVQLTNDSGRNYYPRFSLK